jgi:pyrimidine-nucleoside phosphorylase
VRSLVELIAHKRDGGELAPADVERLVAAFHDGSLADYQMSAFCMAVLLRGMTSAETAALTHAMLRSGAVIDLAHVARPKIDKHSTGGVGDKVSLCLAPLVAACGVAVPMISGRGLGHTGGTLDKLEAIPGLRVDLSVERFRAIVAEVGVCMIGQTAELAPADKRMYALRDVTATVESIPLIVASILSKKLAEGIDGLVLDVKVGRGAFMKTEAEARRLAEALCAVAREAGKRASALCTDMDAPLGRTVGNALETREALEVLRGEGPADLVACTLALGAEMLSLAGVAAGPAEAEARLRAALASGEAARVMERMIEAQGGDPRVVTAPERLPAAPLRRELRARGSGVLARVDALEVGLTAVALGAGRTRADERVDPAVGIELARAVGDPVAAGDVLAVVHARGEAGAQAAIARLEGAFGIEGAGASPRERRPVVLGRVA